MKVPSAEDARASSTILDSFLFVALVSLCVAIFASALGSAKAREELRVASVEARDLREAFRRYHERNDAYPDTELDKGSDMFESLRRRGYYSGELAKLLPDGKVDAYDTPRNEGQGREFWVEMTLASDPSIRMLVARSDDAPLAHGTWTDGAFVLRDGKLEPIR